MTRAGLDEALVGETPTSTDAAMLMRVETQFRLFGYPGLAMLCFLVAAAGALWLAFDILSSDRPARRR